MSAVPALQQWHQKCLQTVLRDVLWGGNRPRAENHCSKRREKPKICINPGGKLLEEDTESRKYFYLHASVTLPAWLQSALSTSRACALGRTLSRYLYFNYERCGGRGKRINLALSTKTPVRPQESHLCLRGEEPPGGCGVRTGVQYRTALPEDKADFIPAK